MTKEEKPKVIYCGLYNEICFRDWCTSHASCGAGASDKRYLTKAEAEAVIQEKNNENHKKEVTRAIKLLESEPTLLKENGYTLTKII